MLSKKLRLRKQRQSRKRIAQRDNLISEVLERREMLTGDMTLYNVELENLPNLEIENNPLIFNKLDPNSYSLGWGQNGGDLENQWTSNNPAKSELSDFFHRENIIDSIQKFEDHLVNQKVAEVSDNLIGVFYNQVDALYPTNLERAWAGQSDNLYTLLQLNQRYPGGLATTTDSNGNQTSSYQISNMTMQAMMRVVGFPFNGEGPANITTSGYVDGPDNPIKNSYSLNFLIFSIKDQDFITTNPLGKIINSKKLKIQVPTIDHFFEFTNNPINGRNQSGQTATGGAPVGPLPPEVLVKLKTKYTDIGPTAKNPIQIFSEISGISNLSSLLLYPDQVTPVTSNLTNVQVYDAKNVPLESQNAAVVTSNYTTYQQASVAIGGYYNTFNSSDSVGPKTQTQIKEFFDGFVASRLSTIEMESGKNSPDESIIQSTFDELAIGLRALMALAYDASPLWTSYGIGFANAANPMVGKPLTDIQTPDSFIDLFNGQEIQLTNIAVPQKSLIIGVQEPLLTNNYTTDGWFSLDQAIPLSGLNYFNTAVEPPSYTTQYELVDSNTAVVFQAHQLNSDTISAAGINDLSAGTLTPDSLIDIGGTQTPLREVEPTLNKLGILPDNFATFTSTAGGIDRVTGSPFSDIIVGPSNKAEHGRLTVSSGDGEDIVIPGRGGSLVELGLDKDTIVIRLGDLFGTANLLDFKMTEDTISYDQNTIKAYIDTNDAATLIFTDKFGQSATKKLRLTPLDESGDMYWSQEFIDALTDQQQLGSFNYLETHTFVDPTITDLSNSSFRISSAINMNADPNQLVDGDLVSVSIGDVQLTLTAQHDNQANEIFVTVPLGEFITKGQQQNSAIAQQLISGESFTVSVVPLRSVDSEVWITSGTFNQALSNPTLRNAKNTTILIDVASVDNQDIHNWFGKAGGEMYLFGNGKLIGTAVALTTDPQGFNSGYVEVYVHSNEDPTEASVKKGDSIGWKYATESDSTAQQLQIFVSRKNGWDGEFDKIFPGANKYQIKASDINAFTSSNPVNYNFATHPPVGVSRTNVPFSEWRVVGPQQIAFMGGLANFIYSNELHYSSPNTDAIDRPIEITIDKDIFPDSGSGKVNLSSNFAVFTLPSSQNPTTVCSQLNQYQRDSVETGNTQNSPTGKASTRPLGMPYGATFLGTHSLATKNQIFINGTGRINLANVSNKDTVTGLNSHPEYEYGARNLEWTYNSKTQKPYISNHHPDWASNIYYTIGTDIVTASSTHTHLEPGQIWEPAITAVGFTAAWPMIKGIGGVRFQEFDSIGLIQPDGVELRPGDRMRHHYPEFTFRKSKVFMRDFKQVGGWNWQADGPQIGGWESRFNNSFIHANDDSLKFGAPKLLATNNTILQGSAGVAVGTSYGYVNGGFQDGIADGVFVHRVTTLASGQSWDNAIGLVSAWASPIPEYFYDEWAQNLTVENVFVPSLELSLYEKVSKDITAPTKEVNWDLNHVTIGANVYFEDYVRTFPMKTNSQENFSLQLGEIDMYKNWRINTHVVTPNTVAIGKTKGDPSLEDTDWENTSVNGTFPNAYRDYPAGLTSPESNLYPNPGNRWQMVSQTNATGPQWNNGSIENPLLYQSVNNPTITVTTAASIKLFSQNDKLTRPKLKRASKIRINRDANVIGPQPVRMMHSHIKSAVSSNPGVSDDHSYVITGLASGKVEKKQGESWVDVSTPPKSSNPFELLALLRRRLITSSDEIRWVPDAEDHGEVSTEAFELIGWNGTSASKEKTSIEIDASGWQDF
ncbi:MAG: hypothetical protein ACR2NF_12400 [Pirellulales bacterium]